jgi:S1-C subfamily serine protease
LAAKRGILVSRALGGGNAEKAGLRGGDPARSLVLGGRTVLLGGDVILSIDGLPVWTVMDFLGALEASRPQQTAQVEVLRGTEKITIPVVLADRSRQMAW